MEMDNGTYVPGLWRCAKCKLDLTATVLCVGNGGMYANTKPQDCPNRCGPMWRVTEREERKDAQARFCAEFDKRLALEREIVELRAAIDIAIANTQLAENPVAIAALACAS